MVNQRQANKFFGYNSWKSLFNREQQVPSRQEVLTLYRQLHKQVKKKFPRLAQSYQKSMELQYMFKRGRRLTDAEDIRYSFNVGSHVLQNFKDGVFPPMPRVLPEIHTKNDIFDYYRVQKWMRNIQGTSDSILQPGQIPEKIPFIECKQFHSEWLGLDFKMNIYDEYFDEVELVKKK